MFLFMCPVFSEEQVKETIKINGKIEYDDNTVETIYLDDNIEKPEVNIPGRTLTIPSSGVLNIKTNANTSRSALARAMVSRNALSDILPLSGSVVAQSGGFSYGSTWGEELSYSQMESTTSFFLKYDFSPKYSLTSSIRQSANKELENQYSSVRITPEWHITDKLTLKNSFTNYLQSQKNKNELTLVYTPSQKKYAEALKFELGVAQSYYVNGNHSAGVNFSTGFKL